MKLRILNHIQLFDAEGRVPTPTIANSMRDHTNLIGRCKNLHLSDLLKGVSVWLQ
jgi:hypothetical protein